MVSFISFPVADLDGALEPTSDANAVLHSDTTSLTGLTNDTTYRTFVLANPSPEFTPEEVAQTQFFFTPSGTGDVTSRWVSATPTFEEGPPPYLTLPQVGSNSRRLMSLDEISGVDLSSIGEVELYLEAEFPIAATATMAVGVRIAGSAGSETGYVGRYAYNSVSDRWDVDIPRYNNGTFNLPVGAVFADFGPPTVDTRYCMRFRCNDSEKAVKVWLKSESEPGSFHVTRTDNDVSAAGRLGFHSFHVNTARWFALGIGLDGAAAPTS